MTDEVIIKLSGKDAETFKTLLEVVLYDLDYDGDDGRESERVRDLVMKQLEE